MSGPVKCPRCGHLDTFTKGFLSETCVCRVCQSQLDWREVPGLGADCRPLGEAESEEGGSAEGSLGGNEQATDGQRSGDSHQES